MPFVTEYHSQQEVGAWHRTSQVVYQPHGKDDRMYNVWYTREVLEVNALLGEKDCQELVDRLFPDGDGSGYTWWQLYQAMMKVHVQIIFMRGFGRPFTLDALETVARTELLVQSDTDDCTCQPDGDACNSCVKRSAIKHGDNIPF